MNYRYMILSLMGFSALFSTVARAASLRPSIDEQIAHICDEKRFDRRPIDRKMAVAASVSRPEDTKFSEEAERYIRRTYTKQIFSLASSYFFGRQTVLTVVDASASWALNAFEAAASMGDSEACLYLAYCCENGIEVPKDEKQAQVWRDKAAAILRKDYRTSIAKTCVLADMSERAYRDGEEVYIKDAIAATLGTCKMLHFGIIEGVRLDCIGRSCDGACKKPMCGGDSIVLVENEGNIHIGHTVCLDAILWKHGKSSERKYIAGFALQLPVVGVEQQSKFSRAEDLLY